MSDNYLVAIQGLRGIELQKWSELATNGEGKAKPTLKQIELTEDQWKMSITELGAMFANELAGISADSQDDSKK